MNEDELEEERIHTNAMYADEDEVAYLQEYEENNNKTIRYTVKTIPSEEL